MIGKVILIGAGPGDPDLLTLKGKEYIKNADCIIYDRLASKDILNFAKKDAECIFVGKENHKHVMKQEKINELLVQKAKEYKLVVRLKGGDPYVFGRGGEEALYLRSNGIEVEVLSGVTSVVSVLASAGIPITHRGLAKGFSVITAHSKKDAPADIDFSTLTDESVTLVFLMGLSHVGQIAKGLMDAGRSESTPAAVISKGTTTMQKTVVGILKNIEDLTLKNQLESPSIIVVGEVVTLAHQLPSFEERPLYGKKFLVPYIEGMKFSFKDGILPFTENRLATLIREKGGMVQSVKVGQIRPISFSLDELLKSSGWLVFTSANGVNAFMYQLHEEGLDLRAISDFKIAVVGEKTAACLEYFSITADFIPKEHRAKTLFKELGKIHLSDEDVFYFSAKDVTLNEKELTEQIPNVKRIVTYENACCEIEKEVLRPDAICFTSASCVNRFFSWEKKFKDVAAVSIGPSCTESLKKQSVSNIYQAKDASYEGILNALIENK